ncbi:MAG: hypothetical protein MMC23_003905 [Stictis urceolatum]|nr:hypothetical protein [Stictis urceolata]
MTQRGTYSDVEALMEAMRTLEHNNYGLLKTGKSCFEKHSLALFLASAGRMITIDIGDKDHLPKATTKFERRQKPCLRLETRNSTCGTPPEIAHLHGSDGSLHMTLHPSDAKLVIENGWGERHPLAGRGTWVPKGFMMIYAPRNQQELDAVVDIMRAGCWWVSGIEL